MLEQQGNALTFLAYYTSAKVGKTGLTVTCDVYKITSSTPIVSGASATELGGGTYYYTLASGSNDASTLYIAVFKTTDTTVDQQHIPALWVVGRSWVNNVDAATTSRAAASTAVSNVDYTSARAAKIDNLDATVSSRSSHAAADIWAVGTRTLTSFGTLVADAAAAVWAYATRTLTQSAASVAAVLSGSDITVRRGDSWSIALTDIGALTGYTSLWLTVKNKVDDADTASILQIKKNASGTGDGLLYVNAAAASDATKGAITINDQPTGDITITVDESVTATMNPAAGLSYDIQVLNNGSVTTLTEGQWEITGDYTRAIT